MRPHRVFGTAAFRKNIVTILYFLIPCQIVPVTVITSVPGVEVTTPVVGFCEIVAAGTVISKVEPLGSVRSPPV